MCGIAGIVKYDRTARAESRRLLAMRDALRHRGPDDAGLECRGRVGLAHRRLSIIDLAGGHQPMASADGTVHLVHNGEIYNYRELRGELEALGRRFATASDTEVVIQAYQVWGEDCLARFRGMFAFALWDDARQRLFAARDRLGIKPFHYAVREHELLFGSEIKALVAALPAPRLDPAAVPEYLASRYLAGERTFFAGVRKLLPGHCLRWDAAGGLRVRRWWRLPETVVDPGTSLAEEAVQLRERLTDAVRSHLVSDVPVGLFLSGGLDSSGLAALMAPMVDEPIHTFSVGFAEDAYNELPYARRVAGSIGALHRDVKVSASQFIGALPSLIRHEDEPIAFPSSVPLYFVSALAREHVKVVMTGEGADELFLGYNRYRVTALNERLGRAWRHLPDAARRAVRAAVPSLPPRLRRYAERSFLVHDGIRDGFCENFSVFPDALRAGLLSEPSQVDPHRVALECYARGDGAELERMARADLQTYLVELLMKQDQMSMAASIESRVPFLDHRFVEYAATLPARYKVRGWRTKAVLRAALEPLVPREILTRRKMGFPVPIGDWCRGRFRPLLDDLVLGPRALGRGLFREDALRTLVAQHLRGEREHGDRLWLLINLELWQRLYLDGEPVEDLVAA